MNENEIKRKVRIKGKGLSVVSYTPEAVFCGNEPCIRKQVARTIMLPMHFGQSDIEVLYKFSDEPYRYPLLELIHQNIKNGVRYKPGDRLSFTAGSFKKKYTAEFCKINAGGETMLRAVILELDKEYQSLPSEKAAEAVIAFYESKAPLPFSSIDDSEC